jgi:hypothetical protein
MQNKAEATSARFEMFGETSIPSYIRGRNVRKVEKLCSLRGRHSFKVYITSKVRKCGIKTWLGLAMFCKSQTYMGPVGNAKETEQGKKILCGKFDHPSGSGINVTPFTSSLKRCSRKHLVLLAVKFQPATEERSSIFGFATNTVVSYVSEICRAAFP